MSKCLSKSRYRSMVGYTVAVILVGALLSMTSASRAHAVIYENYLLTTWGRLDHSFSKSGTGKATLNYKLTDRANSNCVYAKATVDVNNGPDYSRDLGKVCGAGRSTSGSYTFQPVVGTSINGATVYLCEQRLLADSCIHEYNVA